MIATLADIRKYLRVPSDVVIDDELLTTSLIVAQELIETATRRKFEVNTTPAVRKFNVNCVSKNYEVLYLDCDLVSATQITDGVGRVLLAGDYRLEPYNHPPYTYITALSGMGYRWQFGVDEGISINGTWGYSATPPASIKHAVMRLAAWLYKQRDTHSEVVAVGSDGVQSIPQRAMPRDVYDIIKPYVRPASLALGDYGSNTSLLPFWGQL